MSMSFYQSSSFTHNDSLTLTYGMTFLTSVISFSLEKNEVVSLDCGMFYPNSGLDSLNEASMKVQCDIDAGIEIKENSLRRDDHKSCLLSIKRVDVCGVCNLFPNRLII